MAAGAARSLPGQGHDVELDLDVVGDHGVSKSRLYWWTQGLGNASVGTCNTFTASSDKVR